MAEEEAVADVKTAADVADKAVSTDDLAAIFETKEEEEAQLPAENNNNGAGSPDSGSTVEFMRLEAVLAALVQNKVISIKASSNKSRKGFLRPRSFSDNNHEIVAHAHVGRGQRLTSTSTGSSSHEEQYHHRQNHQKHHQHHHHHHHRHHRKRQSDSALLSSGLFPRKRVKHHHHRHHHHHHSREREDEVRYHRRKISANEENGEMFDEMSILQETTFGGSTASLAPATPGPSSEHGSPYHNCHGHLLPPDAISYCSSPTHSHSQMLVPLDSEYIALQMELEDEEFLRHPELTGDLEEGGLLSQKKRKKRRKKRKFKQQVEEDERPRRQARMVDPEDLPKRARWTIIATACLLLLMSVLLVGVTLRMAPIIDEMVRKQNEQHQNSLIREGGLINGIINITTGASPTGDVLPTPPH